MWTLNKIAKASVILAAVQSAKQGNALPVDTVVTASDNINAVASCINSHGLNQEMVRNMAIYCHPPTSTVTVTKVTQTVIALQCGQPPATIPVDAVVTEVTVMASSAFAYFKVCPAELDGNTCRAVTGTIFGISANFFVNHVSPWAASFN